MKDSLSEGNPLFDLGPLYHSYTFFGIKNQQLPGIFEPNQKAKAPILTAYIAYAVAKVDSPTFMELFCADGFYAMVAKRLGASKSYGVDNNRDGFSAVAPEIAKRLAIEIEFINAKVENLQELPGVDIVANVGGLYHVSNPKDILMLSYRHARKYLIVQSVVSLATNSDSYFESPCPGWTWGSRFSKQSFDKMIHDQKWNIIDSHFNELTGNARPEDRGSVYYLIEKG
jgi:hypothetical protein